MYADENGVSESSSGSLQHAHTVFRLTCFEVLHVPVFVLHRRVGVLEAHDAALEEAKAREVLDELGPDRRRGQEVVPQSPLPRLPPLLAAGAAVDRSCWVLLKSIKYIFFSAKT